MTNIGSEISIQELVANFRESLISVGKGLQRVGVSLADEYSGDAWDDASETLFYHLVIDPIRTGLETSQEDFSMPHYEVGNFNYSEGSFIQCNTNQKEKYAFFGLLRRNGQFDKFRCYELTPDLQVVGEKIFLWKDSNFSFNFLLKDGTRKVINSIILRD